MAIALYNPSRVDVRSCFLTQGGASRLRRFADPGLCCIDPVGVKMNRVLWAVSPDPPTIRNARPLRATIQ